MKRITIATIAVIVVAGLALALRIRGTSSTAAAEYMAQSAMQTSAPQLLREQGHIFLVLEEQSIPDLGLARVQEVPLPAVLETTGQVTFDDRLVSTIISRVSGRLEDIRVSQWDTVRAGENILSLYSPDFMTAEAEYLESVKGVETAKAHGQMDDSYGLTYEITHGSADLKEAAVRKLQLLGLSPADIAKIKEATPTRWMRAPITGVVVTKLALRGAQVNPGDQLFALATLQRVWITADIYEADLARVKVGQHLEAVTTAFPDDVFRGEIARISPNIDPNAHTAEIRCGLQNPDEKLKPQMLAKVRIITNPGAALVVPQKALVFDTDSYCAYVRVASGRFEHRVVQVASWNEHGYARVVSGLKVGEEVIVSPTIEVNALWHTANGEAQ
jgi:Cu(I)/Ag(I) efflux system membrane fusion protein